MKNNQVKIQVLQDKKIIRFISGLTVYEECFAGGMLLSRYWSSDGQVWPNINASEEELIAAKEKTAVFKLSICRNAVDSFSLEDIQVIKGNLSLRDESNTAQVCIVSLVNSEYGIRVRVKTRIDESPILVRTLDIENMSPAPIGLTEVVPFSGRVWLHKSSAWSVHSILPENNPPVEIAYNHSHDWASEGDFYFSPLGESFSYDGGTLGKSGYSRPAFWLRNNLNGQTFVCEYGYSGNWLMKASAVASPESVDVSCQLGFNELPENEMLRVLSPGEHCSTPYVYAALFRCPDDEIVSTMQHYLLNTVMRKPIVGREIEIEANHRGYLCDRETTQGICNDADIAAEAGVELYVVDAGWYGNEPNVWYNNVGDWFSAPWLEGGLEAVVAHVRKKGMRFGLWMELEASGSNSTLRKEHPDWSMTRYGEPVAYGRALDLTKDEVSEWVYSQVCNLIEKYSLDMFRIDNNHCLGIGGTRENSGMTENLIWSYYDALYDIFARLDKRYPDVVFQNCSGGGGRHDFGMMRYFNTFEFSDCMRPPKVLRVYNGLSMALPSGYGLRVFGTEAGELVVEGDLLTQLRGAFITRPIIRGIAPDFESLSPSLMQQIKRYVSLYKEFIRPILKGGKMYHHTPFQPLSEHAPWMIVEFSDTAGENGLLCAFATSPEANEGTIVYPRGLNEGFNYKVTDDNTGNTFVLSGFELMQQGLRIKAIQGSSCMYLFTRV
ncbi:MAG TPA: alpha-galactosidase [Clostridia bacterium]|nr:alpha-galactosidase [Clostridia bacterium]